MHFFGVFLVAFVGLSLIESSYALCDGDRNAIHSPCSNQCVNNCVSQFCTKECKAGCSCKSKYLYDNLQKRCVLPYDCSVCNNDKNAYYSLCSNQCTNNCDPQICTLGCKPGCSCKPNYVYDGKVKKCVLRNNCSECKGDKNAYHSECSNHCINNCVPQICTFGCQPGCSCKPNYVYDSKVKQCVLRKDCSKPGKAKGYY